MSAYTPSASLYPPVQRAPSRQTGAIVTRHYDSGINPFDERATQREAIRRGSPLSVTALTTDLMESSDQKVKRHRIIPMTLALDSEYWTNRIEKHKQRRGRERRESRRRISGSGSGRGGNDGGDDDDENGDSSSLGGLNASQMNSAFFEASAKQHGVPDTRLVQQSPTSSSTKKTQQKNSRRMSPRSPPQQSPTTSPRTSEKHRNTAALNDNAEKIAQESRLRMNARETGVRGMQHAKQLRTLDYLVTPYQQVAGEDINAQREALLNASSNTSHLGKSALLLGVGDTSGSGGAIVSTARQQEHKSPSSAAAAAAALTARSPQQQPQQQQDKSKTMKPKVNNNNLTSSVVELQASNRSLFSNLAATGGGGGGGGGDDKNNKQTSEDAGATNGNVMSSPTQRLQSLKSFVKGSAGNNALLPSSPLSPRSAISEHGSSYPASPNSSSAHQREQQQQHSSPTSNAALPLHRATHEKKTKQQQEQRHVTDFYRHLLPADVKYRARATHAMILREERQRVLKKHKRQHANDAGLEPSSKMDVLIQRIMQIHNTTSQQHGGGGSSKIQKENSVGGGGGGGLLQLNLHTTSRYVSQHTDRQQNRSCYGITLADVRMMRDEFLDKSELTYLQILQNKVPNSLGERMVDAKLVKAALSRADNGVDLTFDNLFRTVYGSGTKCLPVSAINSLLNELHEEEDMRIQHHPFSFRRFVTVSTARDIENSFEAILHFVQQADSATTTIEGKRRRRRRVSQFGDVGITEEEYCTYMRRASSVMVTGDQASKLFRQVAVPQMVARKSSDNNKGNAIRKKNSFLAIGASDASSGVFARRTVSFTGSPQQQPQSPSSLSVVEREEDISSSDAETVPTSSSSSSDDDGDDCDAHSRGRRLTNKNKNNNNNNATTTFLPPIEAQKAKRSKSQSRRDMSSSESETESESERDDDDDDDDDETIEIIEPPPTSTTPASSSPTTTTTTTTSRTVTPQRRNQPLPPHDKTQKRSSSATKQQKKSKKKKRNRNNNNDDDHDGENLHHHHQQQQQQHRRHRIRRKYIVTVEEWALLILPTLRAKIEAFRRQVAEQAEANAIFEVKPPPGAGAMTAAAHQHHQGSVSPQQHATTATTTPSLGRTRSGGVVSFA